MESEMIIDTKQEPEAVNAPNFLSRIIFALVILGLMLAVPATAQNDQAKRIEEGKRLWEKWIAARGGRERLSAIKDIKTTTEVKLIQQGLNMTLVTYKKGFNKYRQEQKVLGRTITQVINGDTGWMTDLASGSIIDMPKEVRGQLEGPANEHEALLNPEKLGHTFIYEGRKSILAKDYILLNQITKEGVTVTHYIDPETFLRYKYTWNTNEVIESDYRDVAGIKVPFRIRQSQGGQEIAVGTLTEYKINTNLNDSLFERQATGMKEIIVAPEILSKYVGTYKFTPQVDLMITLEGSQLFWQASGQPRLPLFAESETNFFLKIADVEIEFIRDDKGVVIHLLQRQNGKEIRAPRISDTVAVRKEITVSPQILAQYVGTYELKPGFDIVITLEGNQLFSIATGQPKIPLFPETETKFFLKAVDAQVEFFKDEKGMVTHLMLHQGPADVKAVRK